MTRSATTESRWCVAGRCHCHTSAAKRAADSTWSPALTTTPPITCTGSSGDNTIRHAPAGSITESDSDENTVVWSPDGTRLASASDDHTVRIWDPNTGQTTATLMGHTDWVNAAAWSPDGTHVATVSRDRDARVWEPDTGQTVTRLTGHADWVNAVAWSPDGSQLATASGDGIVTLWTREGDESTSVNIQTAISLAWSKDTIAVAQPKSPAIIKT